MYKRTISVTFPEETVRLLDRVAGKRYRNNLINKAVISYFTQHSQAELRRLLEAERRALQDLEMAEERFSIDSIAAFMQQWGKK